MTNIQVMHARSTTHYNLTLNLQRIATEEIELTSQFQRQSNDSMLSSTPMITTELQLTGLGQSAMIYEPPPDPYSLLPLAKAHKAAQQPSQ